MYHDDAIPSLEPADTKNDALDLTPALPILSSKPVSNPVSKPVIKLHQGEQQENAFQSNSCSFLHTCFGWKQAFNADQKQIKAYTYSKQRKQQQLKLDNLYQFQRM